MQRWIKQVKPSHDKYIAPTEKIADFIINTTNQVEEKMLDPIKFLLSLGANK
jgi:uridine kinase